MAKHVRLMIVIGILTGTLGAPLIANAQTPLRFDCDAPVDQFSTEAQIVALPVTVVGTISALAMVSKDYVPSASVAIVSADDKNGVGFQMNAPADDATELDVDHVEMQRGVLKRHLKVAYPPLKQYPLPCPFRSRATSRSLSAP
jgi:hypothetical protein